MITSDNGKNKIVGLSELKILIIPGIKDRISSGNTRYEIFPICLCNLYFFFLIKRGWAISIKTHIEAMVACI
jgi:hypothetical protein